MFLDNVIVALGAMQGHTIFPTVFLGNVIVVAFRTPDVLQLELVVALKVLVFFVRILFPFATLVVFGVAVASMCVDDLYTHCIVMPWVVCVLK